MQNCLLNTIKFLHKSQVIVPFIITDRNLVTIKDVIQVDLLKLLNRYCIIIKYRPINIVHYKWIMKMIHCESNYRNSYFKDGFLYVTFTIPLRLQYTAFQIMQYKLQYLNKDILTRLPCITSALQTVTVNVYYNNITTNVSGLLSTYTIGV